MGKNKLLSLREMHFAKTRLNILHTFLKLVDEKGHINTTIDDICEEAEISRGTFFNYFPSKEHVYVFYGYFLSAKLIYELRKEKSNLSSCDKIKYIFNFTVDEINKRGNRNSIIYMLLQEYDYINEFEYTKADFLYSHPDGADVFPESEKIILPTLIDGLILLLKEGINSKEFRENINIDKSVLNLLSIYFTPPIVYKSMSEKYTIKEVYDLLLDDFFKSVLV